MAEYYQPYHEISVHLLRLHSPFFPACKKSGQPQPGSNKPDDLAVMLTGKWKQSKNNTKIYGLTGDALLKSLDTNFSKLDAFYTTYITYNKDDSGYLTTAPYKKASSDKPFVDTTSYFDYKISEQE
ncbi:hypothetical protein SNE25_20110 [Mucilaginibacter sabulilitoris]|uniref:Uncharacterized protein n=1 Tax=Mucilaginibacter sabulilitoris TaxID=1173583 RepID=A0ABZ0TJ74_9SPHI|nr:hypothetical protein [Mucilaginibacter sabulilitoris]WPU91625.1 hypothetical protein SNE25_20110 [Mucilaginibacter sabulilitoris]